MSISLRRFDYFGILYGFTYDESIRFQTNCGGFLSVFFCLFSIIIVSLMGSSFFDRTNPTVIMQVVKSTSSPTVTFGNRFNIAIRMTYGNQSLYQNLDKIRIKLMLNNIHNSNYNNVQLTEIPLSVCTKDKFPDQYQNYFDLYSLSESLCPDLNNQLVTGDFLSLNMQFLQIQFVLCENDPLTGKSNDGANIVCKNSSEIQNFLQKNLIQTHLFYTDTYYSQTNYTNPEVKYIDNYNIELYFTNQRQTFFYLYNSFMTSDDSYFFLTPSSRQYSNIQYSNIIERTAVRTPQMNNLVMIDIRSDKSVITYQRTYQGFVNLATNIGAMLNIVYIIFNFVVFIFSRIEFFNYVFKNSSYQYKINNNNDLNLKKTSNNKSNNIIEDNNMLGKCYP